MKGQPRIYKVTGVVRFSVDDILAHSLGEAKKAVEEDIGGNIAFADGHKRLELIELKSEAIGLPTRKEYEDAYGEWDEAWEAKEGSDREEPKHMTEEQKRLDAEADRIADDILSKPKAELQREMAYDYLGKSFEGAEDKAGFLEQLTGWTEEKRQSMGNG